MARRLTATTPAELYEIEGLIHDAHFDAEAVTFDEAERLLVVPFAQEELGWRGEPPWELLRRTWLYDEYRVPFMAGSLTIHHVTAIDAGRDWAAPAPGELVSIRYDAGARHRDAGRVGRPAREGGPARDRRRGRP